MHSARADRELRLHSHLHCQSALWQGASEENALKNKKIHRRDVVIADTEQAAADRKSVGKKSSALKDADVDSVPISATSSTTRGHNKCRSLVWSDVPLECHNQPKEKSI